MNIFGKFPGKRMGMLDSGCNELIIKLDDESRAFANYFWRVIGIESLFQLLFQLVIGIETM